VDNTTRGQTYTTIKLYVILMQLITLQEKNEFIVQELKRKGIDGKTGVTSVYYIICVY